MFRTAMHVHLEREDPKPRANEALDEAIEDAGEQAEEAPREQRRC